MLSVVLRNFEASIAVSFNEAGGMGASALIDAPGAKLGPSFDGLRPVSRARDRAAAPHNFEWLSLLS
jgi:hypothetical protein